MSDCLQLAAEIISLAAGIMLAWPALRLHQVLRLARDLGHQAQTGSSKRVGKLRKTLAKAYSEPQWSLLDHTLTLCGLGLFILSAGIRVWLEW